MGPTGAGKTTLMNLLPRFYDPQRGHVLLDGRDVRTLSLDSLRRQISMVPQEPILFSGTIADNIRYGRLQATMDGHDWSGQIWVTDLWRKSRMRLRWTMVERVISRPEENPDVPAAIRSLQLWR